ncbi:MAG: hypothetical protein ACD_61C00007G0005 [uncultured bacterium]|nr:MAG: hypothetical protein ACD_61C00007G0005 [uncultured bacterium]
MVKKNNIAVGRGDTYTSMTRALFTLKSEIISLLDKSNEPIILKPNLVGLGDNGMASTHPDSVRAVIDFFSSISKKDIVIAESSPKARGTETLMMFDETGISAVTKGYKNVKLLDLNTTNFEEIGFAQLIDNQKLPIHAYKILLESKFSISLSKPKSHSSILNSLSQKNFIMGGIAYEDKLTMHGFDHNNPPLLTDEDRMRVCIPLLNLNLCLASVKLRSTLSLLDFTNSLEGNGPIMGDKIDLGFSLASTDSLTLDTFATKLMGIPPSQIPWQNRLRAFYPTDYELIGDTESAFPHKFKLHDRAEFLGSLDYSALIHFSSPDRNFR